MSNQQTAEKALVAGQSSASTYTSDKPDPSPRPTRTLRQVPSIQRVETSLPQSFTVTPASARSTSSIAPSPSCSSYQGSPLVFPTHYQNGFATIDGFALPDPLLSSTTSMSTNFSASQPRQNGLQRKISSGKRALSRLGRTTSSGTSSRRDASAGPVARRRSDSKTSTTATFETDYPVPDLPEGLGLQYTTGFLDDAGSISDFHSRAEQRAEVVAPAVSGVLVGGCTLVKITRGKRHPKVFSLDREGSQVSWQGTVQQKRFFIDDVKSIRHGLEAEGSWTEVTGAEIDLNRCFTINYAPSQSSKGTKTLHLLAPTKHICQLWVKTLEGLAKHREELMTEMTGTERQSVLRAHWDSEIAKQKAKDQSSLIDGLDLPAVARLCRKLHIHCPRSVIEEGFHAADYRGIELLDFDQFRSFVGRLRFRFDLKPLFNQLKSSHADGISKEDFLVFLKQEQGINVDANRGHWEDRFDQLATRSSSYVPIYDQDIHMDLAAFTSFIISKDCHIYASGEKHRPRFDRPMNEYFISSSHNTYLIGRQVTGTSSVEAYVTALRRGCRSVEIDCWNGENENPRVTHGYTGTTSVPFLDVIKAINRCAFDASPYPLSLSLEVHCNPLQQRRMVDIMKANIDRDRLLLLPIQNHPHDLPSPEDLKYKILVKVKATNAHPALHHASEHPKSPRQRSTSSPMRGYTLHSVSTHQAPLTNGSPHMISSSDLISSPTDQSMTPTSEDEHASDSNGLVRNSPVEMPTKVKTSKITQELAALGVYLQGYSCRGKGDLEYQQFNHIFSIDENKAATMAKSPDSKALFEKHNAFYMCRVYPRNTRVTSSNFDPNTFWRRGVQMVALNWQTYDVHMQMNQAMFAAGPDQTGYVLKPHYLRDSDRFKGAAEQQRAKLPHHRVSFAVKVISAQQLPLLASMGKTDVISPFVEIQMISAEDQARDIARGFGGEEVTRTNGFHGIGRPYSRRTKTVPENGYNPQFNDLIELSLDTKYPELVFVRFVVSQAEKNSSKVLAVFTAKLDSLQRGYRHLPLYNSNGEELIFSTLFCHIKKNKPQPSYHESTPARQNSFRRLLSRSNTAERGRPRWESSADNDLLAVQRRLNKEIEAKRM